MLTIKEAQKSLDANSDKETYTKTLEFDELELYIKTAGISCHKQGLYSAFNYFKAERGFSNER